MGDIQPNEPAEAPTEQAGDGIQPIEGFVDPFEDDWDDAQMKESHTEWERLLQDVQEEQINTLTPGDTATPASAPDNDTIVPQEQPIDEI